MSGCGKPLKRGQWWQFCGETDMGQTAPALCTECGGEFILASDSEKESFASELKEITSQVEERDGKI